MKNSWKAQIAWEESHMGNYRCIYPREDGEKYEAFFHQNQSSLFQDTAASRAREECARLQREELEVIRISLQSVTNSVNHYKVCHIFIGLSLDS